MLTTPCAHIKSILIKIIDVILIIGMSYAENGLGGADEYDESSPI